MKGKKKRKEEGNLGEGVGKGNEREGAVMGKDTPGMEESAQGIAWEGRDSPFQYLRDVKERELKGGSERRVQKQETKEKEGREEKEKKLEKEKKGEEKKEGREGKEGKEKKRRGRSKASRGRRGSKGIY